MDWKRNPVLAIKEGSGLKLRRTEWISLTVTLLFFLGLAGYHLSARKDADSFSLVPEQETVLSQSETNEADAAQVDETDAETVPDKISKAYYYEKAAVKYSQTIKRTVFHNMPSLKLSEKFHLRYFALHIENLAKAAENVADQLAVMALRRTV